MQTPICLTCKEQQRVLFNSSANSVGGAVIELKKHVNNCLKADPQYVQSVADTLGIADKYQ